MREARSEPVSITEQRQNDKRKEARSRKREAGSEKRKAQLK